MCIFKCKMCGGTLDINKNQTTATCEYCGTQQTLPRLDDDRRAQMYDRANHFRRNNEFDKAMRIYEKILNDDNTDAEAYWSIVLCRYGIEYVEDPSTHRQVPTVNRTQFTSIFDDENYKSAIQYADDYQKSIYEEESNAINEIQKGILDISQKEEPFDVFICYKETDDTGRRTPDSVLATELYHELIKEGFKVFFSRVTLEDKLGTAYEPYIFAALNSAKVMVVVGTKPEYFNAVWVKNEWSRYLALIKNEAKKTLIPAYRDMNPYDLPEEFSHLQAQDMSKLGFMQDLIHGIKKLVEGGAPNITTTNANVAIHNGISNTEPLLQRVFLFLEDEDWNSADEYCEKVLDLEPQNAKAYLGKLMAELHVRKKEDLKEQPYSFEKNGNYQKILRFGNKDLKSELGNIIFEIKYRMAAEQMAASSSKVEYDLAADAFREISNYKDSERLIKICMNKAEEARKNAILSEGNQLLNLGTIDAMEKAIKLFQSIPGWEDADKLAETGKQSLKKLKDEAEDKRLKKERRTKKTIVIGVPIITVVVMFLVVLNTVIIPANQYNHGVELMNAGEYTKATTVFWKLGDYRNARELWEQIAQRDSISAGYAHTIGLKSNGTVVAAGANHYIRYDVQDWADIATVSTGFYHTVGLKTDGTVVAVGSNDCGQCDVQNWTSIVDVSAGSVHTIGLKSDGTVVAVGRNNDNQCSVEDWTDIMAISANVWNTVGLKENGTVVAVGRNDYGQCDVQDWTNIVEVSAGDSHTVGLKTDGTVIAVGKNDFGQCNVQDWEDIVAISAGNGHTVGLKSDGTVIAVGDNFYGECDVQKWTDIVAVSAGYSHTVGLKSDGTVVAVGNNDRGQCDVLELTDIKVPDYQ